MDVRPFQALVIDFEADSPIFQEQVYHPAFPKEVLIFANQEHICLAQACNRGLRIPGFRRAEEH